MSFYEIRVLGQLDQQWSDWLEGLAVIRDTSRTTLLQGNLADDAALQGVLIKLHNLNLMLISVRRVDLEIESDLNPGAASGDE